MKRRLKNDLKKKERGASSASPSIEGELALASMNPYLPMVDLHGLPREAVAYEVDLLIAKNSAVCTRIIYGHGKGILKDAVIAFLNEQKEKGLIKGFSHEMSGASCVVSIL